jgi:hypothetical protein
VPKGSFAVRFSWIQALGVRRRVCKVDDASFKQRELIHDFIKMRDNALSMFSYNAMQNSMPFPNPNAKIIFMKQTPTKMTTCDRPFLYPNFFLSLRSL